MRQSDRVFFLLLRSSFSNPPKRNLHLFANRDTLLSFWRIGDRVSPLYPSDHVTLSSFSDDIDREVFFAGPLYPGEVLIPETFISLGLYNLVLVSQSASQSLDIRDYLNSRKVPWEQWFLHGTRFVKVNYSPLCTPKTPSGRSLPIGSKAKSRELKASLTEYQRLIRSAVGRAANFHPLLEEDLAAFNKTFRRLLEEPPIGNDTVIQHGLLTVVNNALARHYSQTYSGRGPIIERDFYYQDNSLLGVGSVSLALFKVRKFIERAFDSTRMLGIISRFDQISAAAEPLYQLLSDDQFWANSDFDSLAKLHHISPPSKPDDGLLPLLTCISSRDGFRATQLTLSVPRDIIYGCNTAPWTLLTLTHEVSHCVIGGLLGLLLPNPDRDESLDNAVGLLFEQQPRNLRDQLVEWLCFGLIRLEYEEHQVRDLDVDRNSLRSVIRNKWLEANEILTHVFDFLYFYRKEADNYVSSLWASWAVIPNIRNRIDHYITRTLSALHSLNLNLADDDSAKNVYSTTVNNLIFHLRKARSRFPHAQYMPDALSRLETSSAFFERELCRTENLVKFVRFILYSEELADLLNHDSTVSSGRKSGYRFSFYDYPDQPIENPLRFAEAFSSGATINEKHSAWIIQHLAFAGDE